MNDILMNMIMNIAKVGAQKYAPGAKPIGCEICGDLATESHAVPEPPFARHYCKRHASGIFRDHSCWKCNDGAKPCAQGGAHQCDYPHARND